MTKEGTGARAFAERRVHERRQDRHRAGDRHEAGEKYDEEQIDERHRDHALFIAYAPADNPKIALAILVENGGFGAQHRGADRAPGARLLLARQGPAAAQAAPPRTSEDDEND